MLAIGCGSAWLVLGTDDLVQIAHHESGQHEGEMDDHIPHQLVVRHILGVHKHPQQVNGGRWRRWRRRLCFQQVASILPSQLSFSFPSVISSCETKFSYQSITTQANSPPTSAMSTSDSRVRIRLASAIEKCWAGHAGSPEKTIDRATRASERPT